MEISSLFTFFTTILGSSVMSAFVTYKLSSSKAEKDFKVSKLESIAQDVLLINRLVHTSIYEYHPKIFPSNSSFLTYAGISATGNTPAVKLDNQERITKATALVNLYFPNIKIEFHDFYSVEIKIQSLVNYFFSQNFNECSSQWKNYETLAANLKEKTDILIQALFEQGEIIRDTPFFRNLPLIRNAVALYKTISQNTLGKNMKRCWDWIAYV